MNYKLLNSKCEPVRILDGDAGFDLCSSISCKIYPNESRVIPLGVAFELPIGSFGLLTHRSSMAFKSNCILSLGIIDHSFMKEVKACVFNLHDHRYVEVEEGQRIAQLILINYHLDSTLTQVEKFTNEKQSKTGFGSSGRF